MNRENVVFRKEKRRENGYTSYLAVFCDGPTRPGFYFCLPFHFTEGGVVFESHTEVAYGYYYGDTRIVHRSDPMIPKLVEAVGRYCGVEVRAVEKIKGRR